MQPKVPLSCVSVGNSFFGSAEVQAQTLHLTGVMEQYAQFTGQALNLAKSKAVVQGDWGPLAITQVGGIEMVKATKYLGWYVGDMGPMEQYAGPMRKFELKCQQLGVAAGLTGVSLGWGLCRPLGSLAGHRRLCTPKALCD